MDKKKTLKLTRTVIFFFCISSAVYFCLSGFSVSFLFVDKSANRWDGLCDLKFAVRVQAVFGKTGTCRNDVKQCCDISIAPTLREQPYYLELITKHQ